MVIKNSKMKKTVYVDMDGVLADYLGRCKELNIDPDEAKHYPEFFISLKPIDGAIESINKLFEKYNVFILTSASWSNPQSYVEKIEWIDKYIPKAKKRVIFSNDKNLNIGDYLIDDRPVKGAKDFCGEWLHFGSEKFPNWNSITKYLLKQ